MNNSKLKTMARERLHGNYQVMILAILLFILLGGCCSFIALSICEPWCESLFSSLLMLLLEALIMMGFIGMILKIARKKKVAFEDLFSCTKYFGKYIAITLILGLIAALMSLLNYLAFHSLLVVIIHQAEINEILAVVLVIFGLFLNVAIIMVNIYLMISLSQTYFVLYDDSKLKVSQVIAKSFDMMENYLLEYFLLVLSFIGWAILGVFTFGILYLWLIPYMAVTLAIFYDKVKKDYETTRGNIDDVEVKEVKLDAKPATKKTTSKKTTKTTSKKTTAKKSTK